MRLEIKKALVFISQQFQGKLKTEDLAREAGLSTFHFHRLFIQETQFTPQKYIEKLRLEYAAHVMVLNPSIKMIQLAFESGFPSPSSFSRAFSQFFGKSPSQYKKALTPSYKADAKALGSCISLNKGLEISYLPKQSFHTQLIHPLPQEIEAKVQEDKLAHAAYIFGIYLDAPIHLELSACRYLIGFPTEKGEKGNVEVEADYYIHFEVKGDIGVLREKVIAVYKYLLHLNYHIPRPIAFEKFKTGPSVDTFSFEGTPRRAIYPHFT
ncbi:MAG: AraC family transcriptional regulator [Bacteroidota bacterium]